MSDNVMSDTPASMQGVGELSAAQVASARAAWIGQGLPANAFDQAVGGQPVTPTGSTAKPPVMQTVEVMEGNLPSLTAEQAEQMAQALERAGVDPARIKAAIEASGFELAPDASPTDLAREETEQAWRAQHGFATERGATDYRVDYSEAIRRSGNAIDTGQLAQVNQSVTEFLASLQIQPGLGASLVEHIMAIGQRVNAMSPDQQQQWMAEQEAQGQRSAGSPEAWAERQRLAQVTIDTAEGPFAAAFAKGIVRHDWAVISMLAGHGAVLESYWRGPKKAA